MGQIYGFLGMTVGCIVHELSMLNARLSIPLTLHTAPTTVRSDYLRDNMKFHFEEMVQRDFNFAIVDEVDLILIDEARTPLIISGPKMILPTNTAR